MPTQKWFLHADLDAFFASVEQLDFPEYRGKPLIVGGKPEDKRSVVSTASYEARKYGVHSAMPTYQAYKLCPQGIFVYGRMKRYCEISYEIMNIFKDFSPDIQQISIDEAFIDLTGTELLFGNPENTALQIKKTIKEKIGLTISIGLASSKYFAKLASEINKPDGFYFVKPGEEQQFIHSLPLKDIWGLGSKSLELLNKNGIYTTKDVYNKSLDYLIFTYGENKGNFLYNIARGITFETFDKETKSHSISNETTFPININDSYTAETTILELCQNTFFRLLKQNGHSRTVKIKVRYDDFSTISAQLTEDQEILTVDSMYLSAKKLFESKYENGRGIRLIGVGFDNITLDEKPYQQDLFSTKNSEKRQAVEKAICNLEKKHPEIKVHKARFLNKTTKVLFYLILTLFLSKNLISAEENKSITSINANGASSLLPDTLTKSKKNDTKTSLFNWKINDKNNVEFLASGFWKMEFTDSLDAVFGFDNPFSISFSTPVFKQEIDLSVWIELNKKFYFQADFAKEFKYNTFALGYNGSGFIKKIKLSNRGIIFPEYYSANQFGFGVSGGNNQAPGISIHIEDTQEIPRWSGDLMFRYEMTKTKNATFYGKNSVVDTKMSLDSYITGKLFYIPSSYIQNIESVFVEDESGLFLDSNGIRYRRLSSSEYQLIPSLNEIIISKDVKTTISNTKKANIAITFYSASDVNSFISSLGSYTNQASYLGEIQSYFNSKNNSKINLSDFSYNLVNTVNSKSAIIIQSSNGFSPFAILNKYDCGINSEADIYISTEHSNTISSDYTAIISTDEYSFTYENYFDESHMYADVYNKRSKKTSYSYPSSRYPFADLNPEVYLTMSSNSDLTLLLRSYSPVNDFFLSTEAIASSIRVYRNNILDNSFVFSSENGTVKLSSAVSETDKIYITWEEENSALNNGALSGGIGFIYNFLPSLKADISITARWPLSPSTTYSTYADLQNGFASISGGIDYTGKYFSISDKTSLSISNDNTTGVLLASFSDSTYPKTYYLSSSSGYITLNEPVLSSDYFSTITLHSNNNGTIKYHTGISDSLITGYSIPLTWNFSNLNENCNAYASVDIKLEEGSLLKNSSELEIAIKPTFSSTTNYSVYLQLGIEASSTIKGENSEKIPTWKISDSSDLNCLSTLNINSNSWQVVKVSIPDKFKSRLASYHDARLIVVSENLDKSATALSGSISVGPYSPIVQGIATSQSNDIKTTTSTILNIMSPFTLLHVKNLNYASKINWTVSNDYISNSDSFITTVSYFEPADFSQYENINLDFYYKESGKITHSESEEDGLIFILDTNSQSIDDETAEIAMELHISPSVVLSTISTSDSFHYITINTKTFALYIDGIIISPEKYSLFINKSIIPSRKKIKINTILKSNLYKKGEFAIGDLYYSNISPKASIQNKISSSYIKKEDILSINGITILKNLILKAESTQSAYTNINNVSDKNFNINNSFNSSIDLHKTNFTFDTNIVYATNNSTDTNLINSMGHQFSSISPLLNILSFTENYRFLVNDKSTEKKNSLSLNFSKYNIPLSLSYETTGKSTLQLNTQKSNISFEINQTFNQLQTLIKTTLSLSQKRNKFTNEGKYNTSNNYFTEWINITNTEISGGYADASIRNETLETNLNLNFKNIDFKPTIKYVLSNQYKNTLTNSNIDNTNITVTIPFSLANNTLTFTAIRNGGGTQSLFTGYSYLSDTQLFAETMKHRLWFYNTAPFYDLFATELPTTLLFYYTNSVYYSTKYELNYKRKISGTISDLFIPTSTTLLVIRDIRTSETLSDIYQYKLSLNNTALNIFGQRGTLKIFDWFLQDEYVSSIELAFKLTSSVPSFAVTTYSQILLYLSDTNILKYGLNLSYETNGNWSGKTTFIWDRNSKFSPFVFITQYLFPKTKEINFVITRTENINISLANTDSVFTQDYEYTHSTSLSFLKNYSVNLGLGGKFSYIQNKKESLSFTISLGCKIEF